MDPDAGPVELQRKVMFDIRYYFCRRGGENFINFKKNTFQLCYDNNTNIAYVKKSVDEMQKNHNEKSNVEIITGFMPRILADDGTPHKLCPVRSFENYSFTLNPDCEGLWQKPWLSNYKKNHLPFYEASTVGKNPLNTFMSKLSAKCELSKVYTNHSVRVTGVTNLTRSHYTPRQIMAITGHKSIQSLAIYQRVKEDEKMMMGMSLMYSLLRPADVMRVTSECRPHFETQLDTQQQLQIQAPPVQQAVALPSNLQIQPQMPKENFHSAMVPIPPPVQIENRSQSAPTPVMQNEKPNIEPENAVIPFDANINENQFGSFLQMLMDDEGDNDLLMAATQLEQKDNEKRQKSTAVVKKSSPKHSLESALVGCKIGAIGTLNIHIHQK